MTAVRVGWVVDIVGRLREYGIDVDVADPWVDAAEAEHEYGLELVDTEAALGTKDTYNAVVLAVGHDEFAGRGAQMRATVGDGGVVYDVKGLLAAGVADGRL